MAWPTHTEIDRRYYLPAAPGPEQAAAIAELHELARALGHRILELTPQGADQSAALRYLDAVLYTAVSAVQTGGSRPLAEWIERRRAAESRPNGYLSPPRGGP